MKHIQTYIQHTDKIYTQFTKTSRKRLLSLKYCVNLSGPPVKISIEPHREKTGFLPMQKQRRRVSFAVTAKLISAFVFATQIVHFVLYLTPTFQACSSFL